MLGRWPIRGSLLPPYSAAAFTCAHARCGDWRPHEAHRCAHHHFVRDAAARGEIVIEWVPTLEQLADVCTKGSID
jgi:hypothetical protein